MTVWTPTTTALLTPGNPAIDATGATDIGGLITIVVQLDENSQATLVAHEAPTGTSGGWTVRSSAFSSQ